MATERRRPRNLVWLPDRASGLTTMCRGAVLTVERDGREYLWTVAVDGHKVSYGTSPSLDNAQNAAVDAAVDAAGGG